VLPEEEDEIPGVAVEPQGTQSTTGEELVQLPGQVADQRGVPSEVHGGKLTNHALGAAGQGASGGFPWRVAASMLGPSGAVPPDPFR